MPSRSASETRQGSVGLASPRLARLARADSGRIEAGGAGQLEERCELCGAPIGPEHRHLLNLDTRGLLCACRPCSTLFDRAAAGGGHYRLIGDRRLRLDEFELKDILWERLRIPVDMAFFFHSSPAERVIALYPSPMGATESRLELDVWTELEEANPILGDLRPDIEALLVNRAGEQRSHWLLPIDDCYRLVAVIRTNWRGFTGGREVWLEIDRFFRELGARARPAPAVQPQMQRS